MFLAVHSKVELVNIQWRILGFWCGDSISMSFSSRFGKGAKISGIFQTDAVNHDVVGSELVVLCSTGLKRLPVCSHADVPGRPLTPGQSIECSVP